MRALLCGSCCADDIFIQIYFRMHHFVVKFSKFSSPQAAKGHWSLNQNPANALVLELLIGNESAPIQLAQCQVRRLAISDAKVLICFSNKMHGSNFIEQQFCQTALGTVLVWNYQNTDCSLCVISYNLRHTFVSCGWIVRICGRVRSCWVGI